MISSLFLPLFMQLDAILALFWLLLHLKQTITRRSLLHCVLTPSIPFFEMITGSFVLLEAHIFH